MRLTSLMLLVIGLSFAALTILSIEGSSQVPWYVDDHVIIEEKTMELNATIIVRAGGILELRGSTLLFNNSDGELKGIQVLEGGNLMVSASNGSRPTMIDSTEQTRPTFIDVKGGDLVSIEHLVMEYGNPAINIQYTIGTIVRFCLFTDCPRAIIVSDCRDFIAEGNRFENSTLDALRLTSVWNTSIIDNTVIRCKYGVRMSVVSEGLLAGNSINASRTGVDLVYGEGVTITDTDFDVTNLGCSIGSSSRTLLSDCSIQSSSGQPNTVGLTIERSPFTTILRCNINGISKGIRIVGMDGFSPTFNLVQSCLIEDCSIGVLISASNNTISDTRIVRSSRGIAVVNATSGGVMEYLEGNAFRGCVLISCDIGILIGGADRNTLSSNMYVSCDCDLEINGHVELFAEEEEFEEWTGCAIRIIGGILELGDCFFRGPPPALVSDAGSVSWLRQSNISVEGTTIQASAGSLVTLVNTTHTREYDVDASSSLHVVWDVQVSVLLESGKRASASGSLLIIDFSHDIVLDMHIIVPAFKVKIKVPVFIMTGGVGENLTPHNLLASAMGRNASTTVFIESYMELSLVLDDQPPIIIITSPAVDAMNYSAVHLTGMATDGSGRRVDLTIQVDGVTVFQGADTWDLQASLDDGVHSVFYTAKDGQGNIAEHHRSLLVDTTPPSIIVFNPNSTRVYTRSSVVEIDGEILNGEKLTMNGAPVPMHLGRFNLSLPLDSDGLYTIVVTAMDSLLNSESVVIHVTKDTDPPMLHIREYPMRTRELTLTVEGNVSEPVSLMMVNGIPTMLDDERAFATRISLIEGENEIIIEAIDLAGNTMRRNSWVLRDTVMHLDIVSPLNGTVFQLDEIEVLLLTEPGSSIHIGNEGWTQVGTDGYCRLRIDLYNDTTELRIEGIDELGNSAVEFLVVHFRPPMTVDSSYPDWYLPLLILFIGYMGIAVALSYARREK